MNEKSRQGEEVAGYAGKNVYNETYILLILIPCEVWCVSI
jgi:hypothetical protein